MRAGQRRGFPYQVVALPAVHQPVHDAENLEPEVQHSIPLGKCYEVVQEDFAEQRGSLHSRLTHTAGIALVSLGLE